MSTAPFTERPAPAAGHPPRAVGQSRALRISPPAALAAAMLLVILFAAFAHGGASLGNGAWIQAILAGLLLASCTAWLWERRLRFAAPRIGIAAIALLVAFTIWSGASLIWSIAPDRTWTEFNRDLIYALALCLAVFIGASDRRAPEWALIGFVLVAAVVTVYALAQKLVPGLHVPGLFNLDQAGRIPRLQEPLGYWNALALFISLAVPGALVLAAGRERTRQVRSAALSTLALMLLTIGFTFSRGALIALVIGVALTIVLGGSRLRSLMWLVIALLGIIAPLVYGLAAHALTAANVPLGTRAGAGGILAAILLASLAAMLVFARVVERRESQTRLTDTQLKLIGRALTATAVIAVLGALVTVSLSGRGLTGNVTHAWHSFTTTRGTSNYDPTRLLSADSENRWVWWKEAAGAFSDRPVLGWGAGSFPVVHLLYRRNTLNVNQPHSVPLQFLAETGVIGTLLAMGALLLLIVVSVRLVRRSDGRSRLLMAAMLGGGLIYVVHCLYDWDWDIPAVTLPALLFFGVLVGAAASSPSRTEARTPGITRLTFTALLTLTACAVALSGALPSIAASQANASLVAAAGQSPNALSSAAASAAQASRLDPLSDTGLRVEATIAERRGQTTRARGYLLDAVKRDPADGAAWQQLAYLELVLGDRAGALLAAERVLALDPSRSDAFAYITGLAQQATLLDTPPADSPTAQPTRAPLSSGAATANPG